jgi:hypothetical protein
MLRFSLFARGRSSQRTEREYNRMARSSSQIIVGRLCALDDAHARRAHAFRQVSRGVLLLEPVPRPVWDAEAVRHIISGMVVAGHRF